MKKTILKLAPFLFATLFFVFLENCGSSEEEPEPNKAPSCSITSPSNNSTAEAGTAVKISVSASDSDGTIANVKISIDDTNVSTLTSSPYSYDWDTDGVSIGQHTIKAIATDNGGLTTTSQITMTITAAANEPTVTTTDITEITATTAKSGGNVTDDGGSDVTARGVVWGESSGPTVSSNSGKTSDGSGTGTFSSSLAALTAGTKYYVRAYATNDLGTSYGEEKSFTTTGLPVVTTGSVSEITNESAKVSGEITDNGGSDVTEHGLVWSTTNTEVTLDDAEGFTSEGNGTGAFTSTMTTLTRYSDYWVRAYATNSAGTSYGHLVTFKTLPDDPVVITYDVTDIEAHIARAGGEVTDNGGDPHVGSGLVWATYENPEYGASEGFLLTDSNPFDTLISGLVPTAVYHVRAWALNSTGNVVYGEEKTFTAGIFSVTTGSFTDTRDNKVYNTITISDQTWMAENLAYLPEVCASDAECGYWVYDYQGTDVVAAKATSNYSDYGVLYNYEIANSVCPTGWHLPSDYEWSYLEVHLGMTIAETIGEGYRGTDQGGKMKESGNTHWIAPNYAGTNSSQFTALPGGFRNNSIDDFEFLGTMAYFWSSSKDGDWINYRYLANAYGQIGSDWISYTAGSASPGGSVRCVQD